MRPFDLAAVPVGEIASADKPKASDRLSPLELDKTLAGDERKAFHAWLTDRWEEKDKMLAYFAEHGEFECAADQRRTLKLELRTIDDYVSGGLVPAFAIRDAATDFRRLPDLYIRLIRRVLRINPHRSTAHSSGASLVGGFAGIRATQPIFIDVSCIHQLRWQEHSSKF